MRWPLEAPNRAARENRDLPDLIDRICAPLTETTAARMELTLNAPRVGYILPRLLGCRVHTSLSDAGRQVGSQHLRAHPSLVYSHRLPRATSLGDSWVLSVSDRLTWNRRAD